MSQQMREALERIHNWLDSQADAQSKGGHATFDLMMLREHRDIAEQALAASEPAQPESVRRQYFYKMNNCKAQSACESQCMCWHDIGTGPLADHPEWQKCFRENPAPAQPAVTDRLTIQKTSELCIQHGYKVTGYILSNADGVACTVNMSNVQWFGAERKFPCAHTKDEQPAVVQQLVEALKHVSESTGFWRLDFDGRQDVFNALAALKEQIK